MATFSSGVYLLLLDKRMLPFPVVGFYYLTCLPLGEHIIL
jgi:hypothetical protein